MTKQLFFLLISFSLLFFSCSKDDKAGPTPISAPQSVYSVVDISNSPGVADTYLLTTTGDQANLQVLNGSFSYTADSFDINMPIGGTFPYMIIFNMSTAAIGCADIEIRTYHNNSLIDTQNFQTGYNQITPQAIFCDPLVANNNFSITLDIEAN